MPINFKFKSEGYERHSCRSRREGAWLIFECPECSYVRKWNLESNKMKLENEGNRYALHNGSFEPVGLQSDKYNPN